MISASGRAAAPRTAPRPQLTITGTTRPHGQRFGTWGRDRRGSGSHIDDHQVGLRPVSHSLRRRPPAPCCGLPRADPPRRRPTSAQTAHGPASLPVAVGPARQPPAPAAPAPPPPSPPLSPPSPGSRPRLRDTAPANRRGPSAVACRHAQRARSTDSRGETANSHRGTANRRGLIAHLRGGEAGVGPAGGVAYRGQQFRGEGG